MEGPGQSLLAAFYLIDHQGRIRERFVGETHVGEPQAQRIEAAIADLLAEVDAHGSLRQNPP